MRHANLSLLALGALLVFVGGFWADGATQTEVVFHLAPFQTLSLADGPFGARTAYSVHIPQPSARELARGHVDVPGAVTLNVHSNAPWVVNVRALSPDMGHSDDGAVTKPLADFQLRAANRPYITLDTQDQRLIQGDHGRFSFEVDYRVRFDPRTHRDGDYALDLLYTITSR